MKIRLQKIMAESGFASRRKSEEYIAKGKVKINGRPAKIGDSADPKKDIITVEDKQITSSSKKYYIMLHKPRGYVTTMSDELERKCVADLIKDIPERLHPIGRLDRESEGLLLMTNDGAFSNTISHPSGHVKKMYRVSVKPAANEEQLIEMSSGMVIDGKKTAPCVIRVLSHEKERSVLEVVLGEGRNRQIRKMCEGVGLKVLRLKRNAIGPLKLGMLAPGKHRELTKDEIRKISAASQKASERNSKNDSNTTNGKQGRGKRTDKRPYKGRR